KKNKTMWNCLCDCGNERVVDGYSLSKGSSKSCGCNNIKHGMKHTPEYNIWGLMKSRCSNLNDSGWENYGARGITVCERWLDFSNFIEDMGERPSPEHSLDRIDVNGNYCKANCRWATHLEQAHNKRTSKNNTTGYKGVAFIKAQNKYRAVLKVKGKTYTSPSFFNIEDAVRARKELEEKYIK
ncbi:TPA: AP2 domain-containing protein, partial [Bacillus thuringiensis]|nr:AP2 domain-containing protein [Bacillus thuringiensis]